MSNGHKPRAVYPKYPIKMNARKGVGWGQSLLQCVKPFNKNIGGGALLALLRLTPQRINLIKLYNPFHLYRSQFFISTEKMIRKIAGPIQWKLPHTE